VWAIDAFFGTFGYKGACGLVKERVKRTVKLVATATTVGTKEKVDPGEKEKIKQEQKKKNE